MHPISEHNHSRPKREPLRQYPENGFRSKTGFWSWRKPCGFVGQLRFHSNWEDRCPAQSSLAAALALSEWPLIRQRLRRRSGICCRGSASGIRNAAKVRNRPLSERARIAMGPPADLDIRTLPVSKSCLSVTNLKSPQGMAKGYWKRRD